MAHAGPRAFPEVQGEKVNTTAFVLCRESFQSARQDSRGVYFRLVKETDAEAKKVAFEQALGRRKNGEPDPRIYEYRQGDFAAIPGSPWVYWITPTLLSIFKSNKKIGDITHTHCGMTTSDNFRFLRYWWEVGTDRTMRTAKNSANARASHKNWFPYMKGGESRRWYGNQDYVVNWGDDGAEIMASPSFPRAQSEYFKRGITWSEITGRRFGARLSPGGFIFDVKGSSAFPTDIPLVLGLLNSSFANYVLELVNPTISFQVGDVARIPVPIKSDGTLRGLVDKALCCAKSDSAEDETTYDFMSPPDWPNGGGIVTARHQQLARMEQEIDEEVYRLYEISAPDRKAIEAELAEPIDITEDETSADTENESAGEGEVTVSLTPEDLAKRWFSYSVGVALGRFQPGIEGALGCGRFSIRNSRETPENYGSCRPDGHTRKAILTILPHASSRFSG